MKPRRNAVVVGLAVALWAAVVAPAKVEAQHADLDLAFGLLRSQKISDVQDGIQLLGTSGDRRAARFLAEYVRQGVPGDVVQPVVEALTLLAMQETVEPLVTLSTHRRSAVRARAAEGLALRTGPRIRPTLERMLGDSDLAVRSAAARGLARAGNRESTDLLFRAFDRGVLDACLAIGALGRAPDVDRLLEKLGQRPLGEIMPGLRTFLDRRDVPEPLKVRIVQALQDLGTVEVRSFFEEWITTMPGGARSPSREAALRAMERIAE